MKLITKIYLAAGFILLFFLIVTITFLWQASKTETEMQRVIHSTELLRKSEALQKSKLDMETGLRGYLLAENEIFLKPYYQGKKDFAQQAAALKNSLEDPVERKLILEIEADARKWIAEFAEVVINAKRNALQNKNQQAAFDSIDERLINAGAGKKIMDVIRAKFDVFDAYETNIRNKRAAALERSLLYTRLFTIGLTIIALVIGTFTVLMLVNTFRKRLIKMIRLAETIAEGNFDAEVPDVGKDEMSRLAYSLNEMAKKLKNNFQKITKANRELDQFAYVVSHDLKAPLRAINNLAEWIEEDITDTNPEIRKNLKLMRGRVLRMENLINGILAYSKIDRKTIEPETFSLKQLLEEITDLLAPPENAEIVLPEKTLVLTTEKIYLQQIFANLIGNALKYNNKQTPHVIVQVRDAGPYHEFTVTDNGPGIPEKFHEKVFGIFQTMEARDTKESTGIGLAIVKKIIDEKGGNIKISSKENTFTSFIFTWPKNN